MVPPLKASCWARPGADRSAEFERRSARYSCLDRQFCGHTRFFAAAAMVNIALARLFSLFCTVDAPCSFAFLMEVGAALEKGNVHFVGEIISKPPGNTLDHMLVRAEQEHLQEHVRVYQTQRPDQWDFIRRQLNRLLNDRYVASLSRWCDASRRIVQVLREVRGDVGRNLDFASESHRIRIGLGIIDHIRKR